MIRAILFLALLSATFSDIAGCLSCEARSVMLSVDSLFRLIDERNHVIKLNALYVNEAEAGVSVARGELFPKVNASLSVGYLGNGYVTADRPQ